VIGQRGAVKGPQGTVTYYQERVQFICYPTGRLRENREIKLTIRRQRRKNCLTISGSKITKKFMKQFDRCVARVMSFEILGTAQFDMCELFDYATEA
jgi:hypothetical protein